MSATSLLSRVDLLSSSGETAAMRAVRVLSEEWSLDAAAYRPVMNELGTWTLEDVAVGGDDRVLGLCRDFEELAWQSSAPWPWNPIAIESGARNRAILARTKPRYFSPASPSLSVRTLFPKYGYLDGDHAFAHLCDGPFMLSYLGVWRDRPFTRDEESTFQELLAPLAERLRVERMLGGVPADLEALSVALEASAVPSFLLRGDGAIELTNDSGMALLSADRRGVLKELARAIRSDGAGAYKLVPLRARVGVPARFLAIRDERAREAPPDWKLTARQREVLAGVAQGRSNKEIAARLSIAEVTVELHLTTLLRKAGVETRLQLAVAYWRWRCPRAR